MCVYTDLNFFTLETHHHLLRHRHHRDLSIHHHHHHHHRHLHRFQLHHFLLHCLHVLYNHHHHHHPNFLHLHHNLHFHLDHHWHQQHRLNLVFHFVFLHLHYLNPHHSYATWTWFIIIIIWCSVFSLLMLQLSPVLPFSLNLLLFQQLHWIHHLHHEFAFCLWVRFLSTFFLFSVRLIY